MKRTILSTALALASVSSAFAAPSAADRCVATKDKAVGKYLQCLAKADITAIRDGASADDTRCDAGLDKSWAKAEAPAACPTTGDLETVRMAAGSFAAFGFRLGVFAPRPGKFRHCTADDGYSRPSGATTLQECFLDCKRDARCRNIFVTQSCACCSSFSCPAVGTSCCASRASVSRGSSCEPCGQQCDEK